MFEIVLASQSPRRRELLEQIGVSFTCHASEKAELRTKEAPQEVVRELSLAKARDIAAYHGQAGACIVIGADTVVSVDGRILGKPKDQADAVRMIEMLQGRDHEVFTGVTLVKKENGAVLWEDTFSVRTEVTVCPMSRRQIEAYVRTGESMDKAGAYAIQGLFASYVRGIRGDYNNVVGLPVCEIYQRLLKLGVDITEEVCK